MSGLARTAALSRGTCLINSLAFSTAFLEDITDDITFRLGGGFGEYKAELNFTRNADSLSQFGGFYPCSCLQ